MEEEIAHFHKMEKELLAEIGKLNSKISEESHIKTQL